MSNRRKQWLLSQMILQGYRVYKFSGKTANLFMRDAVKLNEFPKLIFIKNKVELLYG